MVVFSLLQTCPTSISPLRSFDLGPLAPRNLDRLSLELREVDVKVGKVVQDMAALA